MEPAHLSHPHLSGHASPEVLALALFAACAALVLALLPAPASDRSEWPYLRVRAAGGPVSGITLVYSPAEARLRFSVGGYRGSDVFGSGVPTSVEIDCRTRAAVSEAVQPAGGRLRFDRTVGVYTYRWAIRKEWRGSCRRFSFLLADGTAHTALFRFENPATRVRTGRCGQEVILPVVRSGAAAPAPDRGRSC